VPLAATAASPWAEWLRWSRPTWRMQDEGMAAHGVCTT
jgi:hypothetical protein